MIRLSMHIWLPSWGDLGLPLADVDVECCGKSRKAKNMAPTMRLKANELVLLLAGLLNLDVEMMARVGNLPVRNLKSWLAGKKENLRPQSVISLMNLLGLKVENGIRLHSDRVHYWHIDDGMFKRTAAAYEPLTKLSKLLAGCSITAVAPPKPSLADKRRCYYLLSSPEVRVVVCVSKSPFKRGRVSPDVIKGAVWRDDNERHSIPTTARLWTNLVEKDLTVFEFEHMFTRAEETVSWADVALMAREFGVTAENVADWIAERFGDVVQSAAREGEEEGMDIEGGGKLLFFRARPGPSADQAAA